MWRYFFLLTILSAGCAQVKPLSGGEKDTIPPNIIKSIPKQRSTDIELNSFYFEFNEIIDATKLKEKIIISPYYKGELEVNTKKNTLNIVFDTLFEKNTTYILNFADGVTDITEQNASIDSKFIFSTGNTIDSSSVSGVVFNPLKNKPVEGAVVGLYNKTDSLDLFHKKPIYFSVTNEFGWFKIENIKKEEYVVYAFLDENKNFQAEYKKELFGFLSKTILVKEKTENVFISVFTEDLTPLRLLRKRGRGDVYEIIYNKKIKKHEICCEGSLMSSLNDNNITVFKNSFEGDSVFIKIKAFDFYDFAVKDSFYIKFDEKEKKERKIESNFELNTNDVNDTVSFSFKTNIPLLEYKIKDIKILADTVEIPKKYFYYYSNKRTNNLVSGKLYINTEQTSLYLDSLNNSVTSDSLGFDNDSIYRSVSNYYKRLNKNKLLLEIDKGTILTIDKDSIEKISEPLTVRGKNYFGGISGNVKYNINESNIFIELVNESFSKIIKNKEMGFSFDFKNIPPGKYFLRVIEDINGNGVWDYYSIINKKESEKIIYYPEVIEILSNWDIEDIVFDVEKSVEKMFE